jgi:solute carrier family 35 protein
MKPSLRPNAGCHEDPSSVLDTAPSPARAWDLVRRRRAAARARPQNLTSTSSFSRLARPPQPSVDPASSSSSPAPLHQSLSLGRLTSFGPHEGAQLRRALAAAERAPRAAAAPLARALAAAALYASTAVAMTFVNKAALRAFPLPSVLLAAQMAATLAVLLGLRAAGALRFPALRLATAARLLPVAALYTANVGFALFSLQALNVPMYNALKRTSPLLVLLAKRLAPGGRAPPRGVAAAVAAIVAGCVVAGAGDFSFDPRAYAAALTSCVLQAAYLLLIERSGADAGVSTPELLTYTSALSLPLLAAAAAATGEAAAARGASAAAADALGAGLAAALLAAAVLLGVALNYALFLCTALNSALTTVVVGALKGVATTALGFVLLGGVQASPLMLVGLALNSGGGVAYSAVKYRDRAARRCGPRRAERRRGGAARGGRAPGPPRAQARGVGAAAGAAARARLLLGRRRLCRRLRVGRLGVGPRGKLARGGRGRTDVRRAAAAVLRPRRADRGLSGMPRARHEPLNEEK